MEIVLTSLFPSLRSRLGREEKEREGKGREEAYVLAGEEGGGGRRGKKKENRAKRRNLIPPFTIPLYHPSFLTLPQSIEYLGK